MLTDRPPRFCSQTNLEVFDKDVAAQERRMVEAAALRSTSTTTLRDLASALAEETERERGMEDAAMSQLRLLRAQEESG